MQKGPFLPSEFVPSRFSTAQDKADFGNAFLHFIESEWARTAFSKSFYNRLSMCFSHIAHYDAAGFYETWFTSDAGRLRFLRHTLAWPCRTTQSIRFAMSSAPSSKRFVSATISHAMNCESPRPCAPLKWRPSRGLRRNIDRLLIKRRLRIRCDRLHQHPHRKSQSRRCPYKPASSDHNIGST